MIGAGVVFNLIGKCFSLTPLPISAVPTPGLFSNCDLFSDKINGIYYLKNLRLPATVVFLAGDISYPFWAVEV